MKKTLCLNQKKNVDSFPRMLLLFTILSLILAAIPSCAARVKMSESEIAAAKKYSPPRGQGFLYVYRPARLLAAVITSRSVAVNGQDLASNRNGTCVVIPLRPGTYQVQAAIKPFTEEQKKSGLYREIPVVIRSGKCSFIRQIVVSDLPKGRYEPLMLMSGGGGVTPIMMSNSTLSGFLAEAVIEEVGRRESAPLKIVESDPYDYNPPVEQ
jgi:hypothetical protein